MTKNPIIRHETHFLHTKDFGKAKVFVFEISDSSPIACIVVGDVREKIPLVRIHSKCFYSEVLGSLDCDCQEQINLAFKLIRDEGFGIFIYLEQEGRGCGLINKARAYSLKEIKGLDTVDAYESMGLDVDPRQYDNAVAVLKFLNVERIRLLTNNPRKTSGLVENGIKVQEVRLQVKPTPLNLEYLKVKQRKLGHDLGLNGNERNNSGVR